MQQRLPIKNIAKLNWMIASITSVLLFAFLIMINENTIDAGFRFVQTFMLVGAIGFFNLFLLRAFQNQGKAIFLFFSFVGALVLWFLIKESYALITGEVWEGQQNISAAYTLGILAISILNTLVIILHNLVILQDKKSRSEMENLQLKANASETANLLLRQQIHPHFLFNALNTIKSLYKQDIQQGEDYLVHLANFLRVSISNHTTKTTLVRNEMEFCMDYLKMQKIRFGDALNYTVDLTKETIDTKYLPYFSLQPLVENALKHNDFTEERPLSITIKEENGYLLTINNLQERNYKEPSTGYGLSNLSERYRLLSGEEIKISSDHSFFTVSIKILNK